MIAAVTNCHIWSSQVIISTFGRVPIGRMKLPNSPISHTNRKNNKWKLLRTLPYQPLLPHKQSSSPLPRLTINLRTQREHLCNNDKFINRKMKQFSISNIKRYIIQPMNLPKQRRSHIPHMSRNIIQQSPII